jgi:DNA polymerase-3 subunit alpha
MESDGQVAKLIETALALEGLTRHASKHAAGVVIATKPLIEMVPLYKDPKSGEIVTTWEVRAFGTREVAR